MAKEWNGVNVLERQRLLPKIKKDLYRGKYILRDKGLAC
jgi:hypothetical protein